MSWLVVATTSSVRGVFARTPQLSTFGPNTPTPPPDPPQPSGDFMDVFIQSLDFSQSINSSYVAALGGL